MGAFMVPTFSRLFLLSLIVLLASCSSGKREWTYVKNGSRTAIIIDGKAVPPANIPHAALRAVAAGNELVGKPYRMGGGHKSFKDSAYDCSGTVGYLLHAAGCLDAPTTSGAFRKFGSSGAGKWITVYAKNGHTFITVAGLRMDTGYNGAREGPKWTTRPRPTKGYVQRHPTGL